MLAAQRVLTLGDAHRFVADHGFVPPDGAPGACLGIEIEWHTVSMDDPTRAVPFDLVERTARAVTLPGGSRLTFEPGGQVELSSRPLAGFDAHASIVADGRVLIDALGAAGVGLVGMGLLPGGDRPRLVHSPRYDAMERHFDAAGTAGRTMMRRTAAVQANVDLGTGVDATRRWRLAHALGPVLGAAFANSPFGEDGPSGWCSTRLAVWRDLERGRAVPIDLDATPGDAWAAYALQAPVMFVRIDDDEFVAPARSLSFADWIIAGHELGWPTLDDLGYHLTTLFPPVRPHGWLELRMIDGLPLEWATVPASVAYALFEDPTSLAAIARALEPVQARWADAARASLHDPEFATAADVCFSAAREALARLGAPETVVDPVARFHERYVQHGRCPADDLLDLWKETGRLVPDPEPVPCAVAG